MSPADGYDLGILRRFKELFPDVPLSKMIQGYFQYIEMPLVEEPDDEDSSPIVQDRDEADDDPFDTVLVICSRSHRLFSQGTK